MEPRLPQPKRPSRTAPFLAILLMAACASSVPPSRPPTTKLHPGASTGKPTLMVAQKIHEDAAVVFAANRRPVPLFAMPGAGDVPGAGAKPVARLAHGRTIRFLGATNASVGESAPTWAKVSVNGQIGLMANRSLITEDRLSRAPRGSGVVFSAISRCYGEQPCSADIWLLSNVGTSDVVEPHPVSQDGPQLDCTSWRPDGKAVALGLSPEGGDLEGLLRVIRLDTLDTRTTFKLPYLVAPAYGPDGTLYARGGATGVDDSVYLVAHDGTARELLREPGTHFGMTPDHESWEVPPAPHPVTFTAGGAIIEAHFYRLSEEVVVRLRRRDGRVISRKARPKE